jgi:hypothetical protein
MQQFIIPACPVGGQGAKHGQLPFAADAFQGRLQCALGCTGAVMLLGHRRFLAQFFLSYYGLFQFLTGASLSFTIIADKESVVKTDFLFKEWICRKTIPEQRFNA